MSASTTYAAAEPEMRRVPVTAPLKNARMATYVIQIVVDVMGVLAAFAIAAAVWSDVLVRPHTLPAPEILALLYVALAIYDGTYSVRALTDWIWAGKRMAVSLLLAAALLNLLAFYFKANTQFPRVTFTLGLLIALVFLAASRILMVQLSRRLFGASPTNVLIIDDGGPALSIPHALRVDAKVARLLPRLDDPQALDRLGSWLVNMDQAIVSCTPDRRAQWAEALKGSGIEAHLVDEFVQDIGALGVCRYDEAGVTAITVSTGPLGMRARVIKRGFDIVVASCALILLMVPLTLTALAIKLADGGPALFVQNRMGRGNRMFRIYKFRTIRVERSDTDGIISTLPRDSRLTPLGGFLRRTSLDELPQLFNVLIGNMSLVGPRPHALGSQVGDKPFWQVDRRYWLRHSLKPGMTGLAQVRGLRGTTRSEADLAGRLQADLEYLSGWSLWRDIAIILGTLRVLVHDRAY